MNARRLMLVFFLLVNCFICTARQTTDVDICVYGGTSVGVAADAVLFNPE